MPDTEHEFPDSWHPSPSDYPSDDTALLTRLRAGDDTALSELHERHVRTVHLLVRSQLRSEQDAEEVTQSAFLLLWRKSRRIDLVGPSCLPWLLVAAESLAREVSRADGRQPNRPNPTEDVSRAQDVDRERVLQQVRLIIATLSDADQELVALCLAEGVSYKRAARRVNSGYRAAGDRFSWARSALRKRRG